MQRYKDNHGYIRETKEHSNAWHRKVAYYKIYLKNREKYPLPFGEYEIHHIDGNKTNNEISNLAVLTPEEHVDAHIEIEKERRETEIGLINKQKKVGQVKDFFRGLMFLLLGGLFGVPAIIVLIPSFEIFLKILGTFIVFIWLFLTMIIMLPSKRSEGIFFSRNQRIKRKLIGTGIVLLITLGVYLIFS